MIITTGAQQAIYLLARALCDPGDRVVVEDPAYVGALQAFGASGASIVAVASDDEGMRTDLLEEMLTTGPPPKCVYVVTDFQNPTGATLSKDRRRHLAALADHHGFVVVADDPYGELRFHGEQHSSIRNDGSVTVVSLGSASKVLSPGLRVGWMVVPEWLHRPVVRAKQSVDLHTSTLTQLLVAELFADRQFMAQHLSGIRAEYADRALALVSELRHCLRERIELRDPHGGMFVWVRFTDDTDTAALLRCALQHGVAFVPGSAFSRGDRYNNYARLCFTTLGRRDLADAAQCLALAHVVYLAGAMATLPTSTRRPDDA